MANEIIGHIDVKDGILQKLTNEAVIIDVLYCRDDGQVSLSFNLDEGRCCYFRFNVLDLMQVALKKLSGG